jgi:hypothetical protein
MLLLGGLAGVFVQFVAGKWSEKYPASGSRVVSSGIRSSGAGRCDRSAHPGVAGPQMAGIGNVHYCRSGNARGMRREMIFSAGAIVVGGAASAWFPLSETIVFYRKCAVGQ